MTQQIEILKGVLAGRTFQVKEAYTAGNGKEYYSFQADGYSKKILAKHARLISE
jgi:hypothetical protein